MERHRRAIRRPRFDASLWLKLWYFGANAAFISIIYHVETSILYVEGNKDTGLEAFMWICIIANWILYLSLQGSDPGYIIPGQERFSKPQVGESKADTDAETVAHASVFVDVPVASAQDGVAHSSTAAANVEHNRLLDIAGMDADPDFDPADAADPVGALKEAEAVAKHGERDCRFCHARQPARAHHCRKCNKCVHTFDHHCTVLGTCIGERNRCRFYWYLFTQSLVIAVGIGILNTGFVWRRTTSDWIFENILALMALITLWILQLFVFGLLVFHTWLAATNGTTFEVTTGATKLWYLAGTNPQECDLPYSRGLIGNLRRFCCVLDTWYYRCFPKKEWEPTSWQYPGQFDRESSDVCNNLWENRYWSCC